MPTLALTLRRYRGPLLLGALLLLMAFGLLGARPLWDSTEGRYANVALLMLERNDWLHPMRSLETPHWTKPPLSYWAIATSVQVFGPTPWSTRLPMALAFLLTAAAVAAMARRLAPGREGWAPLAFGTMFLPAAAAQVVATDMLLTAFCALAMAGYVEARFGHRPRLGIVVMWVGFGLAFLTKGPPALLPLLAVAAMQGLSPAERRPALFHPVGLLLFLLLAFGWFGYIVARNPDLLAYFIGEEVVERVAGDGFGRNTGPWGWAKVYLPVLLVGTLPWTWRLGRWAVGQVRGGRPRGLRAWAADPEHAPDLLIALWIGLPLLVFCVAASRLPLYLLPLFAPMALAIARASRDAPWPLAPRTLALVAVWSMAVLGFRGFAAQYPSEDDAEAWAHALRERAGTPIREVVFIDDVPRYGLKLHLGAEIEDLADGDDDRAAVAAGRDHALGRELSENEDGRVFVTPVRRWPSVRGFVVEKGLEPVVQGPPVHDRVVFTVRPTRRQSAR